MGNLCRQIDIAMANGSDKPLPEDHGAQVDLGLSMASRAAKPQDRPYEARPQAPAPTPERKIIIHLTQ